MLLASNAEQCLPTCFHEVRAGRKVAMLSFLQNGVEVVTHAQRIQPRVARERLKRIEPSVHDVREDLDRAIEVPGVSEARRLQFDRAGLECRPQRFLERQISRSANHQMCTR